jgi:hypothetical protein
MRTMVRNNRLLFENGDWARIYETIASYVLPSHPLLSLLPPCLLLSLSPCLALFAFGCHVWLLAFNEIGVH